MEDIKNPTTSTEDVKTETGTEGIEGAEGAEGAKGEEKFEVTPEQFKKLQELEKNKSIALKKEREEAQKLKSEYEELRQFKEEQEHKEKLKKGKFEELINELSEKNKSLEEKAKAYDEMIEKQKQTMNQQLDEMKEKISPEILEENEFLLEDLSEEKQIKFLEKLMKQSEKPDFNPEKKDSEEKAEPATRLDELRAKKEKGELSSSEKVEYLTLLAKQGSE